MHEGNGLSTLFVLNDYKNRRCSSYDVNGGNHDWWDFEPGETKALADIRGCGVIRHIWCTHLAQDEGAQEEEKYSLSKLVIRMYWDGEESPSVQAPLGDFFGLGCSLRKNFFNAAFSFSPQDGRGMNCYLPMPFRKGARITLENGCDSHVNFYFYIDYEEHDPSGMGEDTGYFHAQYRRVRRTEPAMERNPGILDREKAGVPEHPKWYPKAWLKNNLTGADNYVILEAEGRGKYVGCNLNIDVFERQSNDWYGEGDDMILIDGDELPTLNGTGTEDYFNTAFGPSQEFCAPYYGITHFDGDRYDFPYGGKNCMYRLHIQDPIYFQKSIRVTIEHGHSNILANDYSSTAYWYQSEPHRPFGEIADAAGRVPRDDPE